MKKIVMILAAMAAVLSSCSKSELESVSVNDGKDIVLNISVSNPGADDTKALIKSAWAANDKISIWFDTNTGSTPDLVIKYDGSNWTQDGNATNVPASGNGYVKAIYKETVIVASKDNYSVSDNTLTFSIANWEFLTEIQVVIKDLTSADADKYTLACDKFTPLAAGAGYTVGSDAITASKGTEGKAVTGIPNTDGVAFVFATADYSTSSTDKKDFAFTLKDNTSGSVVTMVYKPNVAIDAKTNNAAIKALTIENSKFEKPSPEYVTIGGKKWAKMNLGATTEASSYETCAGDYYAWGETETYYKNISWSGSTGTFSGWKTGKADGYKWQSYCGASSFTTEWSTAPYDVTTKNLTTEYDVVQQKVGNGWRMPTSQDFQDLYGACGGTGSPSSGDENTTAKGIYWCSSYNGVAGLLFIVEDNGNHLFFPAAGLGNGTGLSDAGSSGYYWSSSLHSGNTDIAYGLSFSSGDVGPQNDGTRYRGFSVRPVSD